MPWIVSLLAAGLVLLGLGYKFGTGTASFTVLIPSILGAVILLACVWASRGGGVGATRAAGLVAAVGLGASLWRLTKGGFDVSSPAHQAQALTVALCGAILALLLLSPRT